VGLPLVLRLVGEGECRLARRNLRAGDLQWVCCQCVEAGGGSVLQQSQMRAIGLSGVGAAVALSRNLVFGAGPLGKHGSLASRLIPHESALVRRSTLG